MFNISRVACGTFYAKSFRISSKHSKSSWEVRETALNEMKSNKLLSKHKETKKSRKNWLAFAI